MKISKTWKNYTYYSLIDDYLKIHRIFKLNVKRDVKYSNKLR